MKRTLILILVPLFIFTVIFFVISDKACDWMMHFQPKKEIPFNHQKHIKEYGAENCETCHAFDENGRFKGIPTIGDCKPCHDGDDIANKYFKNYKDTDKAWEAHAKQPDLVYFSHKILKDSAIKTRCSSCHGDKENSTNTDMIMGKMHMGPCMECHTALRISNACTVCHK